MELLCGCCRARVAYLRKLPSWSGVVVVTTLNGVVLHYEVPGVEQLSRCLAVREAGPHRHHAPASTALLATVHLSLWHVPAFRH